MAVANLTVCEKHKPCQMSRWKASLLPFAGGLLAGYALKKLRLWPRLRKRLYGSSSLPVVADAVDWACLLRGRASAGIHAFYSSVAGAVTTAPECMCMPIDDHAIVRGHAVFDTATLAEGRLYRLEAHLERLDLLVLVFGVDAPGPRRGVSLLDRGLDPRRAVTRGKALLHHERRRRVAERDSYRVVIDARRGDDLRPAAARRAARCRRRRRLRRPV